MHIVMVDLISYFVRTGQKGCGVFFMQNVKLDIKGTDKIVMAFFGGIIAGSIVVNVIPFSWVLAMNVWGADYLRSFMAKSVKYKTMIRYLMRMRGQIMAGIFILMLTPFIRKLIYILPAYIGLAWGAVSSIILMEHGLNGIRICFFLIFPHFIFYGLGIGMTAYKLLSMRNSMKRKPDYTVIVVIIFSVLMITAGIMAEAYVNSEVFPAILRNF